MVVTTDDMTLSCGCNRQTACCTEEKCCGFRKPLRQRYLTGTKHSRKGAFSVARDDVSVSEKAGFIRSFPRSMWVRYRKQKQSVLYYSASARVSACRRHVLVTTQALTRRHSAGSWEPNLARHLVHCPRIIEYLALWNASQPH